MSQTTIATLRRASAFVVGEYCAKFCSKTGPDGSVENEATRAALIEMKALIADLDEAIKREERKDFLIETLKDFLDEALNSGDGVYRP